MMVGSLRFLRHLGWSLSFDVVPLILDGVDFLFADRWGVGSLSRRNKSTPTLGQSTVTPPTTDLVESNQHRQKPYNRRPRRRT